MSHPSIRTFSTAIVGAFLLAFAPMQASAQSNVCDGQVGAAYGLCVAYCEAMECDTDTPNANQTACDRVAENFGGVLPCEVPEVTCPCVDSSYPQWDAVIAGTETISSCEFMNTPWTAHLASGGTIVAGDCSQIGGCGVGVGIHDTLCGETYPISSVLQDDGPDYDALSPEEAQKCIELLLAADVMGECPDLPITP